MKISEMEYHHDEYTYLENKIKKMLKDREFPAIFSVCVEAFPHIVPAIQYRKKRDITPEMPELLTFSVICTYAPPLFEHVAIESLLELVKSTRILSKHENNYLGRTEAAIEREILARILWNSIEQESTPPKCDLYKISKYDRQAKEDIIDIWHKLGIVIRNNEVAGSNVIFRTRLDEIIEGKCHNCGVQRKSHKAFFLRSMVCHKCGTDDYYFLIYPDIHK